MRFAATIRNFGGFLQRIILSYRCAGVGSTVGAVLLLLLLSGCLIKQESEQNRPNIVLIVADDMGFSDAGSYGGEIETPSLDKLAADGIKFSQFYNTSRCSPSRASLLTGQYPHKVQMGHLAGKRFSGIDGYQGSLDPTAPTIAEFLSKAGYTNYMVGKWHLSDHGSQELDGKDISSLSNTPLKRGFDQFYGTLLGGNNYFSPRYLFRNNEAVVVGREDYYYTDDLSQQAIEFVDTHRSSNPEKPFFLYLAYTAPHWPIQAPEESVAKYRQIYSAGWDSIRSQRYSRLVELGLVNPTTPLSARPGNIDSWASVQNKKWQSERMAVHAAMVDHMDQGIGAIVNTIASTDPRRDTLIIFLSDNGASAESIPPVIPEQFKKQFTHVIGKYKPASGEDMSIGNNPLIMPGDKTTLQTIGKAWANASNTPFREAKSQVFEGGIATPMIFSWIGKNRPRGTVNDTLGHIIDLAPTILDIAVIDATDRSMDGISLIPILDGKPAQKRSLYFEHEGNRAVRNEDWKLVSNKGGPWELYDMTSDRTETTNIAQQHKHIAKQLEREYLDYANTSKVKPWSELVQENGN